MNDVLLPAYCVRAEIAPLQPAAAPKLRRRRPIVVVLGTHRGGTSVCSHALSALGVDMADEIGVAPSNPKGHWERWEIVKFHDAILDLFNRSYAGPFHDFSLPPAWWVDPRVADLRRRMTAFVQERMGCDCFGFKDPRTALLMPVWQHIFTSLNLAPKIVLCLRNPAQVARSLQSRDGLDYEVGEYRWLAYSAAAFRFIDDLDFCVIEYEDWFADRAINVNKLRHFLKLDPRQSEAQLQRALPSIVDAELRHDDARHSEAKSAVVRTFYRLAKTAADDPAARERLGSLISDLVGFEQLQLPFNRAYETLAAAAGDQAREIERQAATIAQVNAERDAAAAERDAAMAHREALLADRAALLADRTALLASRSWQLTAPLRKLKALLDTAVPGAG